MKKISVFDTAISSCNKGNDIIREAVDEVLEKIYFEDFLVKIPYLDEIGENTVGVIQNSDYIFFAGTNALSGEMNIYRQWGLNTWNAQYINDVILLGVGWWQYQDKPINNYTKKILKMVLHTQAMHSVRDSYTEKKLKEIGMNNVINTGCPTLWNLSNEHCCKIPTRKGKNVIFTLTDYNKNYQYDTNLMRYVGENYDKVYFWLQGISDYQYIKSLIDHVNLNKNIIFIPPSLKNFDDILESNQSLDYIGTRLHAGVRALQKKRRSVIIGIDNRAIEMKKDFGLPVVQRGDLELLNKLIKSTWTTEVKLPEENIIAWKNQFYNNNSMITRTPKNYNYCDKFYYKVKQYIRKFF